MNLQMNHKKLNEKLEIDLSDNSKNFLVASQNSLANEWLSEKEDEAWSRFQKETYY